MRAELEICAKKNNFSKLTVRLPKFEICHQALRRQGRAGALLRTTIATTRQERTKKRSLPDEVFVGKFVPVDGFSPGSVPPREVASLCHETRNYPVEDRVLLIRRP